MKITKKIEAEILEVMDDYWNSYLEGDLQSWASYLPDDYRNIGTTREEVWNSKQEIIDYTERVFTQAVGMAELRNKETHIIPYDPYVMVHELGDLYIKVEERWTFYAQVRLSSLLGKTKEGWKILHQHGSYPDSKTEEGEAFAFDELKAENKKLRDAIQRRTLELERKNRQLAIEAALERVRTVAMGMRSVADLEKVSEIIFTELKGLGLSQLRNTEIIINHEEKSSITSYYYSDYGVTGVIDVNYNSNPTLQNWAQEMRKADDAFAEVVIPENEIEPWRQYRLSIGYKPDPKLDKAKAVYYYSYSTGLGALSISLFEPINADGKKLLQQFRNVFQLAYQRYFDIAVAQKQAKEASIEASLERVRARAMAMHQSDELSDLVTLVFRELVSLDMHLTRCLIWIFNDDQSAQWWMANPEDPSKAKKFHIPHHDHSTYKAFLDAWKNNEKLWVYDLSGQVKVTFDDYLFNHTELVDLPGYVKDAMIEPDQVILTASFNHFGALQAAGLEELSKENQEILKRFGHVFEQTYTRFLDLKKAEAQAREAQIEAALERVRARTMAMHHSDELGEILGLIFKELRSLDVELDRCFIWVIQPEKQGVYCWIASPQSGSASYWFPFNDHTYFQAFMDVWRGQKKLFKLEIQGELKISWDKYLFETTEFRKLPMAAIESMRQPEKIYTTSIANKYGLLCTASMHPMSEANIGIFQRFGAMFEQSYTRFEDIRKAEAQAREAQIEAALERVRSRSMAMHKSDELTDVATVLHKELVKLEIPEFYEANIVVIDEKSNQQSVWSGHTETSALEMMVLPLHGDQVLDDIYDHWRRREAFFSRKVEGVELQNHINFVIPETDRTEAIDVALEGLPDPTFFNCAFFSKGYLELVADQELSPSSSSILIRFAKVFDQTYTRFLDLQKAEAQAREAQIETALERVRARTMAMHRSDELGDAAILLYQQLITLGIDHDQVFICGFVIVDEENNIQNGWLTQPNGSFVEKMNLPLSGDSVLLERYNAWKDKVPVFHQIVGGKDLQQHLTYVAKHQLSRNQVENILPNIPDPVVFYCANFSEGYLHILAPEVMDLETEEILARFTVVFEMTYRRFLDLQKAEEQAKEAQIEVALERVRASALAMHTSEDLVKVAGILREQMRLLGQPQLEGAVIELYDLHQDYIESWHTFVPAAKKDGTMIFGKELFRKDACALLDDLVRMYKSPQKEYTIVSKGKKQKDFVKILSEKIPEVAQVKMADLMYYSCSDFTGGTLVVATLEEPSNETKELLSRASKVFDLAYRRFLDLQKAEAQTREAQIEMALERVRSASMAMHKSDELVGVSTILYDELRKLGFAQSAHCAFVIIDEENEKQKMWGSRTDSKLLVEFELPLFGDHILKDRYEAWKQKLPLFKQVLDLDEQIKHLDLVMPDQKLSEREKASKQDLPETTHLYFSNFSHGYLQIVASDPLTDEQGAILSRFAKVFEQTYTRFLDLHKAEAQAREAEIEAALERIRSRANGMRHSDELEELNVMLFDELNRLDVTLMNCMIWVFDSDDQSQKVWLADPEDKNQINNYHLQYHEHEPYQAILKGWSDREESWLYHLKGKVKKAWDDFLFTETGYANLPARSIKAMRSSDHVFIYGTFNDFGALALAVEKELSKAQIELLVRFGRVFKQSYTRFLDLQKAEAQAREAQIETALERVRARTMAMHKSEELSEVVALVLNEIKPFGFATSGCELILADEENEQLQYWVSSAAQNKILERYHIPRSAHPFFQKQWQAWKDQIPRLTIVLEGEEKKEFDQVILNKTEFKNLPDHVKEFILNSGEVDVFSHATLRYGFLEVIDTSPISDEMFTILERFAKVFEQTYTRFLDLQKAEAQAREAQIEAALERVRARTMAMHKSEELEDAIRVILDQFSQLGILVQHTGFIIDYNTRDDMLIWLADQNSIQPQIAIPYFDSPHWNSFLDARKKGEKLFTNLLDFKEKNSFYKKLFTYIPDLPDAVKDYYFQCPGLAISTVLMDNVGLYIENFSGIPYSDEENDILTRFGKVFQQTYTRFLDLKKAESQAREAQIEAAVERVRAEAMAMHSTSDFGKVTRRLLEQVKKLDIEGFTGASILLIDEDEFFNWYDFSSPGNIGDPESQVLRYDPKKYPLLGMEVLDKWKEGERYVVMEYDMDRLLAAISEWEDINTDIAEVFKKAIQAGNLTHQWNPWGRLSNGVLAFDMIRPPDEDVRLITVKMTHAFEQAYTRFLDLQRAEAQAREAEIEAALERVRSKTMAMHSSEDVGQCIITMFDELTALGIGKSTRLGIGILNHENENNELWTASKDKQGMTTIDAGILDMSIHPLLKSVRKAWMEKRTVNQFILENREEVLEYYQAINASPEYPLKIDTTQLPDKVIHYDFIFEQGILYAFCLQELSDELMNVFQRFSALFEQTYRRYLDLVKAEAQAREAQIEAALERVRSRAMAMHNSDELVDVSILLRREMGALGVEELETSSIYIHDQTTGQTECWFSIQDREDENSLVSDHITMVLEDTWVGRQMKAFVYSGDQKTSIVMQGAPRKEWITYCAEKSELFSVGGFYGEVIPPRTYHLYRFNHGFMGVAAPGDISAESWDLLKRATAVFSLAYTRFNDLKNAEAQARDALKQAAMDRIRGEIASMRNSEDLNRITPVIWRELMALDVPFIRCGVFIVDEDSKEIQAYLSSPDGKALGVLHLPFGFNDQATNIVKNWKARRVYTEYWDAKRFMEWTESMVELGQVKNAETYQGANSVPDELHLHFVPFRQGMIYVGEKAPLQEEKIEVVQTLADAFSIAYARYEDFQNLEEAKNRIETALSDLQAAQAQLIHSEKMASLGELTAGIAHEIQNPLNFVNNFSEVSEELLEELQQEMDSGDLEEAAAILNDIKQNLEKINHHGKRADGIVKGMLQHSRTSTGQKEPTDLNALCDEYLRLAYHGLRAKDKSFNADYETHFDYALPKVNVIAQDMGRVLLNLINNAFQAVDEKSKSGMNGYAPKVTIGTRMNDDKVEVTVKDNGPGIPDEIRDKIFQPFFTTKPTGQGTGLGLSLSYDIVKAHGGELKVVTTHEEGTNFVINLPIE